MEGIDSPIFGKTLLLDETDKDFLTLKNLVDIYPVNVFGLINKKLNKLGYMITIGTLEEPK